MSSARLFSFILLTVISTALIGCFPLLNVMSGSGNVEAYVEKIDEFNKVRVNDACKLNVSYGEKFSVVINIDDNLRDYIKVNKSGDELIVEMKNGYSFTHYTARVDVTLPEIQSLSASDASEATVSGFSDGGHVQLAVEDASTIEGDLTADTLTLEISDASTAELSGSAKLVTMNLTDASKAKLSGFEAQTVKVSLQDASSASISASKSISGKVEDASTLRYSGDASCTVKSDVSSDIDHQ